MQVNVKKLFDEFASYDEYGNRRLGESRAIEFAEAYYRAMLKAAPKPPITDNTELLKLVQDVVRVALEKAYECNEINGYDNAFDIDLILDDVDASCFENLITSAVPNNTELLSAAKNVIERWDSPLWKDLPHTGEAINRLRKAIERAE